MSQPSADRNHFGEHPRTPGDLPALAAAMSRHPAAGARATVTPLFAAAPDGGPSPAATGAPGPARAAAADDSWVVDVVGDGRGGVAGIGRASLSERPAAGGSRPPARLGLAELRARLAGPARAAEGGSPPTGPEPAGA